MSPASDWRSTDTAEKLMQLDRPQFAVEFLRRNPDYKNDYGSTQEQIASGALRRDAGLEGLARRWGLSFPACTRRPCMGFASSLEAGTFTLHCHHCARARPVRNRSDHPHR